MSLIGGAIWISIQAAYSDKIRYPNLYKELDPDEIKKHRAPLVPRFMYPGIACLVLALLAPSSNTIAVMVVAPAIVNSEPIQKDLPELYKAAKDALMHTLTDK